MTGKWVEPEELLHDKVYKWADGRADHQEQQRAILLDIRRELREQKALLSRLVGIFGCINVQRGFAALRSLAKIERAREKARRERAAPRLEGREVFVVAADLADHGPFGPDDAHTVTARTRHMERGGIVACDVVFGEYEARRHNAARVVYAVNQLLAAAIKAGAVLAHIRDEEIDFGNGVRLHGHTWKVPSR